MASQTHRSAVGVIRAAAEHYRVGPSAGPIVIDPAALPGGSRGVAPAIIDQVAATSAAVKGRADDYLACSDNVQGGRKLRACTMRGGAVAILTFSDLTVTGDTATVEVYYRTARSGRLIGGEQLLTLIRARSGEWKVQHVKERGVS